MAPNSISLEIRESCTQKVRLILNDFANKEQAKLFCQRLNQFYSIHELKLLAVVKNNC